MAEIYKRETPNTEEDIYVRDSGPVEHQRRVMVDRAAEARWAAVTISQVIWFVFWLVDGLIAIRIILRLIAANPANAFANFIYKLTDVFLWPFFGLTASPSAGGVVLEIPSIIGLIVYALLAWVLVRLTWLLLYRPPDDTRVVEDYDRDIR